MSEDLQVVLRGTLARFHRNSCYPEPMPSELDQFAKQISALFEAENAKLRSQLADAVNDDQEQSDTLEEYTRRALDAEAELEKLHYQLVSVKSALNAIALPVEYLACHQEQCDEDGVQVKVSRQAVDEVVNAINQIAVSLPDETSK